MEQKETLKLLTCVTVWHSKLYSSVPKCTKVPSTSKEAKAAEKQTPHSNSAYSDVSTGTSLFSSQTASTLLPP